MMGTEPDCMHGHTGSYISVWGWHRHTIILDFDSISFKNSPSSFIVTNDDDSRKMALLFSVNASQSGSGDHKGFVRGIPEKREIICFHYNYIHFL